MRNGIDNTYEIRVEVPIKGSRHYSSHVGMYIENKIIKTFHRDAKTPRQAVQKVEKYGRLISCRKVDVDQIGGNVERFLSQPTNPYPDAIAMDEFIWRKKGKRNERINNNTKHKNGY